MSAVIVAPPNTLPRIEKLWAYVSKDEHGNEGLCAGELNGIFMPLIAADQARLRSLTPAAEALAAECGMTIVLVEFTARVDLRSIGGPSQ